MSENEEGKGEKRLSPVDVDVLDNLINAQAAYLEAVFVAAEHLGRAVERGGLDSLIIEMSKVSGSLVSLIAAKRV